MSARGIVKLAMRFQLTVEGPDVVSDLFALGIECPAIEGLFCREPPYYLARAPDDQRSSNRVAHALNLIFSKPTHGSVRCLLRLADADLARFFLNRCFFSIGERNLCGAVSPRRDSHGLTLGHRCIREENIEQQGNKKPTRSDHRNLPSFKAQFYQQLCYARRQGERHAYDLIPSAMWR